MFSVCLGWWVDWCVSVLDVAMAVYLGVWLCLKL